MGQLFLRPVQPYVAALRFAGGAALNRHVFGRIRVGADQPFRPSLNAFVLAMPIKSAVASLLLVIYIKLMMDHAYQQVLAVMDPLQLLIPILEAR